MRESINKLRVITIWTFILLISGILFLAIQNNILRKQLEHQRLQVEQQAEEVTSIKSAGLTDLMSHVLNKIDSELKDNPSRTLSDETIARIAALSFSARPYVSDENDTLGQKTLSPERGQLLLMLMRMQIDTSSLDKILFQSSFAGADLKKADLKKAYLRGADLSGADMQEANLQDADLQGANLQHANLWGANIRDANLHQADMKRAVVSWADCSGASLYRAMMDGIMLHSAQMRKADMRYAHMQWADLSGAFLQETLLDSADLRGSVLEKVNLDRSSMRQINLFQASMPYANLHEADLTGANLIDLVVAEETWLELLQVWKVTGAAELQQQFKMTAARKNDRAKFRVVKK